MVAFHELLDRVDTALAHKPLLYVPTLFDLCSSMLATPTPPTALLETNVAETHRANFFGRVESSYRDIRQCFSMIPTSEETIFARTVMASSVPLSPRTGRPLMTSLFAHWPDSARYPTLDLLDSAKAGQSLQLLIQSASVVYGVDPTKFKFKWPQSHLFPAPLHQELLDLSTHLAESCLGFTTILLSQQDRFLPEFLASALNTLLHVVDSYMVIAHGNKASTFLSTPSLRDAVMAPPGAFDDPRSTIFDFIDRANIPALKDLTSPNFVKLIGSINVLEIAPGSWRLIVDQFDLKAARRNTTLAPARQQLAMTINLRIKIVLYFLQLADLLCAVVNKEVLQDVKNRSIALSHNIGLEDVFISQRQGLLSLIASLKT